MKAILEPDNSMMPMRIAAAFLGIADRLDGFEAVSEEEQAEIENALKRLTILESERCPKT